MREKRKHPVHAGIVIGKTARRLKFHEKMKMYRLWEKWEEITGPEIALHARPSRWQKTQLLISVAHPAWMQELSFLKDQMLGRIRAVFPDLKISGVRFEIGDLPPMPRAVAQKARCAPARTLCADELKFIEEISFEIPDPEIRAAAKRAIISALARNQIPEPGIGDRGSEIRDQETSNSKFPEFGKKY